MKKFYVGGSKGQVIAGIIICLAPVFPLFICILCHKNPAIVISYSLFLALWLAISLSVTVRIIKGLKRKNIALEGHKSYGTVKDSYYSGGENSTYVLRVSYVTDSGEEALFTANPGSRYSQYFSVGKRIPIYVNGDYAYFDEEGIKNPYYEDIPEDQEKFIICDCGYKMENGLLYCPKCGKAVEDMHKGCNEDSHKNFCPSCGTSLDPDSKFCKNCGYKL